MYHSSRGSNSQPSSWENEALTIKPFRLISRWWRHLWTVPNVLWCRRHAVLQRKTQGLTVVSLAMQNREMLNQFAPSAPAFIHLSVLAFQCPTIQPAFIYLFELPFVVYVLVIMPFQVCKVNMNNNNVQRRNQFNCLIRTIFWIFPFVSIFKRLRKPLLYVGSRDTIENRDSRESRDWP